MASDYRGRFVVVENCSVCRVSTHSTHELNKSSIVARQKRTINWMIIKFKKNRLDSVQNCKRSAEKGMNFLKGKSFPYKICRHRRHAYRYKHKTKRQKHFSSQLNSRTTSRVSLVKSFYMIFCFCFWNGRSY